MVPKSGAKFKRKTNFCFKNDKNLVNFDPSTKNSKKFEEKLTCDGKMT